ncbi:DUF3667 domain-containing protein [Altererythrobacter xinjiangensis]|uniref:DUF3667 domain-containing protein n=1 Tax=Altericroceibacterium xinjiangense TaxID=762261 RepID=UPI000F7EA81D
MHCHACTFRTAGAFLHDLAHGALPFEGRVWHTLPELVLRPGQLTRRNIEGERPRFVSPAKGTCGLSRGSALWRTVALSGFVFVILFLFVAALLLLGAMG